MGIPNKGSRRITVDGKVYRYIIKTKKGGYEWDKDELQLTVQEAEDTPGNVLQVRGLSIDPPLLPTDVEAFIRKGLVKGWEPSKRGAAFQLPPGAE